MDLFRFIDSKDIREHLRQMGYSFTAPEAAFLVWQCRSTTLKEKIAAWREIIETMPDCSMVERMNMDAIPSVHKFLEQYIALMKRLLENFYCEEHAVYSYGGSYRDGSDFDEEYDRLYPDIVSCIAGLLNDEFIPLLPKAAYMIEDYLQKLANRECKSLPPDPISLHTDHNFEIESIRFKKRSLTSPGESIILISNDQLEPVEMDAFGQFLTKEEENLLHTFQGMWFAFPTPFKRGDLVWDPFCGEAAPFVLNYLNVWDTQEMIRQGLSPEGVYAGLVHNADKRVQAYRRTGCVMDMGAYGYGRRDGFGVWNEFGGWANYLDLEFYPCELKGKDRILRPVSEFLKGNCDLELLLNSYTALLLDGIYGELTKAYQGEYAKDALKMVGLKPEQESPNKAI